MVRPLLHIKITPSARRIAILGPKMENGSNDVWNNVFFRTRDVSIRLGVAGTILALKSECGKTDFICPIEKFPLLVKITGI